MHDYTSETTISDCKKYASAVIRNKDNEFLTINHFKKTMHPWRFVGGKIEEGELPIIACIRELKEELGVEASSLRLLGLYATVVDSGTWIGHFYLLDTFSGTPTIQEPSKHSDLSWLTYDELKVRGSMPEHEVVKQLLASEGKA